MLEFLNSFFDLLVIFLDNDFLQYWFYSVICLAFIATVPAIVRSLLSWR